MALGITQPLEKQFKELLRMDPQAILQSSAPEFLKIAALEQVNKASQAPAQQPQGTVADKVVQQSMSPPGGMGPASVLPTPAQAGPVPPGATPQLPPQMPPQMTAIDRGIGGLPADMTMASGGIVSFAEGGRGAEKRRELEERTEELKNLLHGTDTLTQDEILSGYGMSAPGHISRDVLGFRTTDPGLFNLMAPQLAEMTSEEFRREAGGPPRRSEWYRNPPLPTTRAPTEKDPTIEELASRFGIGVGGKASGLGAVPTVPDVSSFFPERAKYELKDKFDYAKEREKAIKGIGGLPDFFGSQRKAIEEQAKELQGLQRMGNAEALVSAGQSIANAYDPYGRPQTLIGALTEGLGAYTQSKQASNKEVRAEQRALRALESKLAEAEYAEKRGDVDAAVKARAAAATIANELGIKDTDAENAYNITKANAQAASARKQAELEAKYAIAQNRELAANNRAILKAYSTMSGSGSGAMTPDQYEDNVRAMTEKIFEGYNQPITNEINNIKEQRGTITPEAELEIRNRYYRAARAQAEEMVRRSNRPTLGATLESE